MSTKSSAKSAAPRGPSRIAVILGVVAAALIIGLGGRWYLLSSEGPAAVVGGTTSRGSALVGGPFELVDQDGITRTEADFRGEFMLVFFGYTYCPDICPTSLQTMTSALDDLGDAAARVRPVFISIDPERDAVEQMKAYVGHFHERLVGLTGSPRKVADAARAYRVFYQKVEDDSASDYLVDHSSIVYLMGPDGDYVAHFTHATTPEDMAAGIRKHL